MADFSVKISFGMMRKTMPFLVFRCAIYLGIAVAYVLATGTGAGIGYGIGGFWDDETQLSAAAYGAAGGFGLTAMALYFLREYLLYIVKAGHIAVMVEALEGRALPQGQVAYARTIVTERFGQANILFGLDQLIKGCITAVTGLIEGLMWILPIPGVDKIMGLVRGYLKIAVGMLDEVMLAHVLRTRAENPYQAAREALAAAQAEALHLAEAARADARAIAARTERRMRCVAVAFEREVQARTAELQGSKRRLQAIFESSFQHQMLLDLSGRVVDANDASLAAVLADKGDVIGQRFGESIWFGTTDGIGALIDRAVEAGLDEATLMEARLAPDMRPFPDQVRMASFSGRSCVARLTGQPWPKTEDKEASLAELNESLARSIARALGLDVHSFQEVGVALGINDNHDLVLARRVHAADVLCHEQFSQPGLSHARGA